MAWLWFAVLQVALVVAIAWLVLRPRQDRRHVWLLLVPLGGIFLMINLGWLASGGLSGPYAAAMRGGMPGFWVTTLFAVELLVLGILLALRRR